MAPRDPIPPLVADNRRFVGEGRDPAWLRAKLDRLCASPFGFLRGTFPLFVADWATFGDDPLGDGAPQPIVGDLHLENFGAFAAADGRVVFDVNDFDESADGQPALDLMRLSTSLLLADERHGELRAVGRIEMLLSAYLDAARGGDLRPIDGAGMGHAVKELIARAEERSRGAWLAARTEGSGEARRFLRSPKYPPVDAAIRAAVTEAVGGWAAAARAAHEDAPAEPLVRDVAVRIAGTGSLGRFRYVALVADAGHERILELKEALPSSLAPADSAATQALRVVENRRRLGGAAPSYLGVAEVGGRPFTVRALQPSEAKVEAAQLPGAELDVLCAACGTVLGRLHRRGSRSLPGRLAGRDRALARRVAAFALRVAELITEDHAQLVARRAEAEQALGI